MSYDIRLRPPRQSDCNSLALLDRSLPVGDRWSPAQFRQLLPRIDRLVIVFYRGDNPRHLLGYVVIGYRETDVVVIKRNLPVNYLFRQISKNVLGWAADNARDMGKARLSCWARDTDLGAHQELRGLGFRCTKVLRGYYISPPASCYLFQKETSGVPGA